MKELFNKLSNLFSFGKESRMVNQDEAPDMSGPDDSKIDPMEVPLGQEAPDMSGPELENEYTEKEASKLASEFREKAPEEIAKAEAGMKKLEVRKPEPRKPEPRKLTKEEEEILAFEDVGKENEPAITVGEPTITRQAEGLAGLDISVEEPKDFEERSPEKFQKIEQDAKKLAEALNIKKIKVESRPMYPEAVAKKGEELSEMERGGEWVNYKLDASVYTGEGLPDVQNEDIAHIFSKLFMDHAQDVIDHAETNKNELTSAQKILQAYVDNFNRLPSKTKNEIFARAMAYDQNDADVSLAELSDELKDMLEKPEGNVQRNVGELLALHSTPWDQREVVEAEEGRQVIAAQPTRKPRQ
ncbi:hypothetical protein JW752_00630 [Candidatus Peregrinibacteria bacterium]|nr:hypothetical protein [Candidatus Peregrinibacteria bacterium]